VIGTRFKYIPVTEETEQDFANRDVVSAREMSDELLLLNAAVVNEAHVEIDVVAVSWY
jgi:hypothetical protein